MSIGLPKKYEGAFWGSNKFIHKSVVESKKSPRENGVLQEIRFFYLIEMPFAAKILDEPIAFFEEVVYNVSNKSAVCGKNIRWRLLWR